MCLTTELDQTPESDESREAEPTLEAQNEEASDETQDGSQCNALSNYLIILLDDMVYVYILYDFDDYKTYM